ncbi:hypothetical protein CS8_037320 [Cupriavidus sp. 8B]
MRRKDTPVQPHRFATGWIWSARWRDLTAPPCFQFSRFRPATLPYGAPKKDCHPAQKARPD